MPAESRKRKRKSADPGASGDTGILDRWLVKGTGAVSHQESDPNVSELLSHAQPGPELSLPRQDKMGKCRGKCVYGCSDGGRCGETGVWAGG